MTIAEFRLSLERKRKGKKEGGKRERETERKWKIKKNEKHIELI